MSPNGVLNLKLGHEQKFTSKTLAINVQLLELYADDNRLTAAVDSEKPTRSNGQSYDAQMISCPRKLLYLLLYVISEMECDSEYKAMINVADDVY